MPKRKNPFGDCTSIQLKTHVGFNQAATEADKQAVYERTKSLLLRGSNPGLKEVGRENIPPQYSRLFEDDSLHVPSMMCEPMDTPPYTPPVQRQQGILKYFGNRQDTDVVDVPSLTCGSCHCDGVELVTVCGGCGRSVCGVEECLRECVQCARQLCQCCSLLDYSQREVRTFCLDCACV